jgi:hypothetical protein
MPSIHGISTSVLAAKSRAGEPVDALADDYGLTVLDVAAALGDEETGWPLLVSAARPTPGHGFK